jgi:peptidoglycan/LPS O-acetylase OafA/YrhL
MEKAMQNHNTEPKRFGHHDNAFGFLRLVFAILVIVAHTPELLDGDRHRELITALFGSTTFGGIAVDGFFIISGFLITGSFISSGTFKSYLLKRIARIYPGFLAAYLLCLLVVTPLAGGALPSDAVGIARTLLGALLLQPPVTVHAFGGMPYPVVNGAMWTIAYEFRCYLLVMVLGIAGVFRRPFLVVALLLTVSVLSFLLPLHPFAAAHPQTESLAPIFPSFRDQIIGNSRHSLGLFSSFLAGSCLYLYRERLIYPAWGVSFAAIAWFAGLFSLNLVHLCTSLFGGYLLLAIAKWGGGTVLARINNKNDVSYGLYLAGWPIGMLLTWYFPYLSLPILGLTTIFLSWSYGQLSWRFIERPVMEMIRAKQSPSKV